MKNFISVFLTTALIAGAIWVGLNAEEFEKSGARSRKSHSHTQSYSQSVDYDRVACPHCGGTGFQWQQQEYYDAYMGWQYTQVQVTCAGCSGSGYIN